ncbi:hypothetical protein [Novosphingobium sp. JCM 18896]|uniref:hypothetical protein n=1 Tax=Novosphingobium sp. JCM 18896 TaxID=2989731 RepID=UPI002221E680|nr:hypothetical protein [Novosphingobium sp. JCM 18896]MCW1431417.1 hypothetical protein [Novosphingobium sp. JCM 18896]
MTNTDPTRRIVGIERRTAQEVFDIMVDRIRSSRTDGEERKAIVAWLEAEADESRKGVDTASADMAMLYVSRAAYYDQAAGMIKRGVHHRGKALSDLAEGDAELIGGER